MHIVHVLHTLRFGGMEQGVANLIGALNGEFRHTILATWAVGPMAARLPDNVSVVLLGKRRGFDVRLAARMAVVIRGLRPDVVHSRNWGAIEAIPAARLARVPVVIHGEHGREANDPHGLNRKRNRTRRLLTPLVDRFVTVSRDLGRWLVDTVGVPAPKVVTIHNGVDLDRWDAGERQAAREALGLPADAAVIGTVGRLDPVKDQLALLDAFALVRRPATFLVIIGDGPCRAQLEARARHADLDGRVRLLGERSDVPRLLPGFDVFVLPSIAEGISNTILEAMATRLPVVATRTGGNPELVDDGATGALVPVGDREALAASIEAYLEDSDLRLRHGRAGHRRSVTEFGLPRMAERYRDLYRGLSRSSWLSRSMALLRRGAV